jgi:phosphate-selective porin OprO/OprP
MMKKVIFVLTVCSFITQNSIASPEVSIRGAVQLDQLYLSKHRENETSGANLRAAGFSLGVDFKNKIKLNWDLGVDDAGKVSIATLFLKFEHFENTGIMLGQVPSPFCLENSNSSKWLPFLERSLASTAFKPCIGPGVNVQHWRDDFFVNFAVRQPPFGTKKGLTDRWGGSLRAVWSPVHESGNVYHVGGTYSYQDISDKVAFKATEVKGRQDLELVDTGEFPAENYQVFGAEFSRLWGAYQLEAEYIINRVKPRDNSAVTLDGWHVQLNYFLTGQSRSYSMESGSFGAPEMKDDESAWQVAARCSSIDLNADGISGGKENNISFALNWFLNKNIRISTNYVHASLSKGASTDTLALRLQTVF